MKKLLVLISLLFFNNIVFSEDKDLFNIEYKIITESVLCDILPKNNSNPKEYISTNIYILGYISPKKVPSGNAMVELVFFNPKIKSSIKKTNIGWIGNGRYFLILLGDSNRYIDIDYKINILMKK